MWRFSYTESTATYRPLFYIYAIGLGVILSLVSFQAVSAADSSVVMHSIQTTDANGDELAEPIPHTEEIGHTETYDAHLDRPQAVSFEWGGSEDVQVTAELYRVHNDVSSTREHLTEVPTGTTINDVPIVEPIAWEPGTYALEIYEEPSDPPVVSFGDWYESLVRFVTPVVHAQTPPDANILETIRFTVADVNAVAECCSSIVFLPGIKGSELIEDQIIGSDTLWPPTLFSNDISELALNTDGTSVNNVVVGNIIREVLGFSVYNPFAGYLNNLVAEEIISEWHAIPYDWRLALDTVVENGVTTRDSDIDFVQQIEEVTEGSDTGQVTIVGHSMGGLLGKVLIRELEESGKAELVDAFVMVGTPQLGTPKAIAAILHGDGEGMPTDQPHVYALLNNSAVAPATARDIAQNMPSLYTLLPSSAYFTEVSDLVVTFDQGSSLTEEWRDAWSTDIGEYGSMRAFLDGSEDTRTEPGYYELNRPEILRDDLLDDVDSFHTEYDSYTFPTHIRVVEVAGWGLPTMEGIEYGTEHDELGYEPIFTKEGDDTVVYPSALAGGDGNTFYFNASAYSHDTGVTQGHAGLLSAEPVQSLLTAIVREESFSDTTHLSSAKPEVSESVDQLALSVHSPVVVGVYDEAGNFTGIDTEAERIIEGIPGSSFQIYGQSQYIFLPKEGVYEVAYEGVGGGPTTVKIQAFIEDEMQPVVQYSDIPTATGTEASFTIESDAPGETEIALDEDGDGEVDNTVRADGMEPLEPYSDLKELIELLEEKSAEVEDRWKRRGFERSIRGLKQSGRWAERFPWFEEVLMRTGERLLERIEEEIARQNESNDDSHRGWWGWWR